MTKQSQQASITIDLAYLDSAEKSQLMGIFSNFANVDLLDALEQGGGEVSVPLIVADAVRVWMNKNPQALLAWWVQVLGDSAYAALRDGRVRPLQYGAVVRRQEENARRKEIFESAPPLSTEMPASAPESACGEHIIAIAQAAAAVREAGLAAATTSFNRELKTVHVKISVSTFDFRLDFGTTDCVWKVSITGQEGAQADSRDGDAVFQLLDAGWSFLVHMDPDAFPGGLEQLQREITSCVEAWYGLE